MLAFTIVQIVAAIVVGALVIGGLIAAFGGAAKKIVRKLTQPSVHGTFKSSPATIPAAPATGEFVYEVRTGTGTTAQLTAGHGVRFELLDVDSGSGKISTITQDGAVTTVDAMTGDGVTDTNGAIRIVVTLEEGQTARLKASDADSGASTPADDERTFTAQ